MKTKDTPSVQIAKRIMHWKEDWIKIGPFYNPRMLTDHIWKNKSGLFLIPYDLFRPDQNPAHALQVLEQITRNPASGWEFHIDKTPNVDQGHNYTCKITRKEPAATYTSPECKTLPYAAYRAIVAWMDGELKEK